jgi:hypothetical protein
MQINIECPKGKLALERAYVVTLTIHSFKGRKDVEVHLYRAGYEDSELHAYQWDALLGPPLDPIGQLDPLSSRFVILEAFTDGERDQLIAYMKERYADRLTRIDSAPMDFPIPMGLPPLSSFPEGKTIGIIRFDETQNYALPFAFRGLYDLSRHEPLVEGEG